MTPKLEYRIFFIDKPREDIKKILSSEEYKINRLDSSGITALHYFSEHQDLELMNFVLDVPNVNINALTLEDGYTPLMVAAKHGNFETMQLLIERGANVSSTNKAGDTALMIASSTGSVECVDILLKQNGCKVNTVNNYGVSALMQGAKYPEIVKRLFDSTDLSRKDSKGNTALHYACAGGSIEVVSMILENNIINLDEKNENFKSPLHLAIEHKYFDIVEYLIEKGASLTQCTEDGLCAYQYFVIYDDTETFLDKYEIPNEAIISAIVQAAQYNRVKTFEKFLGRVQRMEAEEIENIKEVCGETLYEAAFSGNLDCIKLLLSSNFINQESYTDTLYASLKSNQFECFKYIYDNPPDNFEVRTDLLFGFSVISGCIEACKLFQEQGIDPNTDFELSYLMVASSNGYFDIVKLLVEHGADVNHVHKMGTALMWATERGNLEIVQYLLDNGADPTLSDDHGFTPLIHAYHSGLTEIFFAIYEKDQNIHYQSKDGNTLFLAACSRRNVDFVETLILNGENVNEVNNNGDNCLHCAARSSESVKIFIYLIQNCEIFDKMLDAKNKDGETPLDLIVHHANSSQLSAIFTAKPQMSKYFTGPEDFEIKSNTNDICLICRDEFVKGNTVTILACKHLFHKDCFLEWSKHQENCPYCKSTMFKLKMEPVNTTASSEKDNTSCCLIS